MRVRLRPAVAADLGAVTAQPLPHRIQAITATLGDRVLGIGGIGYRPDGSVIAFAHITDEFRRYPAAVQRAGRAGMALVRSCGAAVVIAEAQPDNPAAERWLMHFGFKPAAIGGWRGFVWRR